MSYNKTELKCDKGGCKKVIVADSRGEASKKAATAGWQLKSASAHYCPDHRSQPVAKKVAKGKTAKSSGKEKTLKKIKKIGNVISFTSDASDKPN